MVFKMVDIPQQFIMVTKNLWLINEFIDLNKKSKWKNNPRLYKIYQGRDPKTDTVRHILKHLPNL